MQTFPPSVGNNTKLVPLYPGVNTKAYNYNLISLDTAEPSLGYPTGYSYYHPNSAYYFTIFGNASTYYESRKFTGNDSLVIYNGNLGVANPTPIYNVDIAGSLRAIKANFLYLSASNLFPSNTANSIYINSSNGIYIDSDVYINGSTYINVLTANNLITYNLSANTFYYNRNVYTEHDFSTINVTTDATINGNITANNVFVNNQISSDQIIATNSNFKTLTSSNVLIQGVLSAQQIYVNKFHGQIDIDPNSPLTYNSLNQLSLNTGKTYAFAVRPSDYYATDDINVQRTKDGPWDEKSFGANVSIDPNCDILDVSKNLYVLKPYFKNIQAVLDYVYANGMFGNTLYIYVDEDIVAGENKANGSYAGGVYQVSTPDQSGTYAGCTYSGNISALFYSTEALGVLAPSLTAAGLKGGDFLWNYDQNADINGIFNYINVYPLKFNTIELRGRYNLGQYTERTACPNNDGAWYFSTWRSFDMAPINVSFRTYVCSNTALKPGQFGTLKDWTTVKTKSTVQGRQFQSSTGSYANFNVYNLNFEFVTNSNDSTALAFYDGYSTLSNVTISLQGPGIYTNGAILASNNNTDLFICGSGLLDPYYLYCQNNQNVWTKNLRTEFIGDGRNYFPGYGVAIVGSNYKSKPTIINYSQDDPIAGFVNITDGARYRQIDYGNPSRNYGYLSVLQASILLDGYFNGYSLFNLDTNANVLFTNSLFSSLTFDISTKYINMNNLGNSPTYTMTIEDLIGEIKDFRFVNFKNSFSTLRWVYSRYSQWAFPPDKPVSVTYNCFISKNNGENNSQYSYTDLQTVNLSGMMFNISQLNSLADFPTSYNLSVTDIGSLRNIIPSNQTTLDTFRIQSPNHVTPYDNIFELKYYQPPLR